MRQHYTRFGLLLGLLTVLLCPATLAAKTCSVDITSAQLFNPADDAAWQQAAPTMLYWVPGWWAALHDEPYINDWRRSPLTEAIVNACRKNTNTRILDAVRSVKTLPPVPDNALNLNCKKNFGL